MSPRVTRSEVVATGDAARPLRCTLSFESADTLREVVGELGQHLKLIGLGLCVEISQRGQDLTVMGEDAAPTSGAMLDVVEDWADANAKLGETPPRVVGRSESLLRGTKLSRGAQAYSLYMFQRVADVHRALDPSDRETVDAVIAGTGWEDILARRPRHRLDKKGYDLVFTTPPECQG